MKMSIYLPLLISSLSKVNKYLLIIFLCLVLGIISIDDIIPVSVPNIVDIIILTNSLEIK
jgi:hypothetical protein